MRREQLIAEVIRNLETPPGVLAFSPTLEEHYRTAISDRRRRSMIIASSIGLSVLAAFVVQRAFFTDTSADPETFRRWLATMAAIGAVSFLTLVVTALSRTHRAIDRATISGVVAVGALVCVGFRVESGAAATVGIYCFMMVPLAAADLASLHFRQALTAIVVVDVIYAVALVGDPEFDMTLHVPALLLVISVSAMTLWGNWRDDRDHRALFLFLTRERLLSEDTAERNAELREMTTLDPLTGIPNRRAFEERFAETMAAPHDATLAVVMIDIDHFKAFNDHYGHVEGDRCLIAVARALAAEMRGNADFIARLGGEEFVALAPGLGRDDVVTVLERLRRAVEKLSIPHAGIDGADGLVTVSLGCALVENGDPRARRRVLERADAALYAAKHAGRNRWTIAPDAAADQTGKPA
ncbi:sensor domain-containing diguanylate cyclase [Pinisolibacter aquiterrae]|uniref:GGDEF domain-containing protein n=1 Tax=Pinisolibacter aquiterrae TaxID=2815579 RepID=UPI001C3C85D5|nr:GGDEF domain-containing protein [Pinisolibacter aquiterrae]MBV5262869.1 GGDEF domain-containing protein [Pinisolibacter aquiterrae]MCC8236417.1 GGDEF domain-containing protein [Pinisolibacter aquiterrae]